jgi:hypothetical protein
MKKLRRDKGVAVANPTMSEASCGRADMASFLYVTFIDGYQREHARLAIIAGMTTLVRPISPFRPQPV